MKKKYLYLVLCVAFCIVPAKTALSTGDVGSASQPKAEKKNVILLKATSPFEDLAEYAISNNHDGMISALKAYEAQSAKVNRVLSVREQQELNQKLTGIKKAIDIGNNPAVAMLSVETYRTLIASLDSHALAVPVQVQMLDYSGFRTLALLNNKPPDWAEIQKAADEAQQQWNSLRPRVRDQALRDAFDTTLRGMKRAADSKNQEMADFAARIDLAQVDLLERYFENPKK